MNKSFVLEGHICRTVTPKELDFHENAFAVCGKVAGFEEGYEFDVIVMDDEIPVHPQALNTAERTKRAVYPGLEARNIIAKYLAGEMIST